MAKKLDLSSYKRTGKKVSPSREKSSVDPKSRPDRDASKASSRRTSNIEGHDPGHKEKLYPRKKRNKTSTVTPKPPYKKEETSSSGPQGIRLNRYIAHCGVCSRREADELIANGKIRVNKKLVTEMGYKVMPGDNVFMGKKLLKKEDYTYVLLNKPKNFITTTKDTHDRKTVMDLVKKAADVRLYPVGRLDRNTTGLLLLTNDGDLADQLSHPSNNIKKIYKVELNVPLQKEHFEEIANGFALDDGPVAIDDIAILTADNKSIGVEIHSGRNRIVRRIFEHFGYEVDKLDRVVYAGLTKVNLPRGKWRPLTEREIGLLKKKGKKR